MFQELRTNVHKSRFGENFYWHSPVCTQLCFQLGATWQRWPPLNQPCLEAPNSWQVDKWALWLVRINTPPSGESQDSFIRRESRCSTQCEAPLQNISAAALSHTTENCDEDAEAVHLPVRLLFLLQGKEQFLTHTHTVHTPTHPTPCNNERARVFKTFFSFPVCWSQTHSDFVPGRKRRLSNSNYASKQPSARAGEAGWRMLEYLLLSA